MPIVIPVPIPDTPPAPQRNDPATFEERNDAAVEYQFETLPAAINQQSEAAYQNALAAKSEATTATQKAQATAEDRVATGQDRTVTGQDRTQTGQDRAQTGQDRTATGQDRQATAADRVKTGEDREAVMEALEAIEGGPVASVNTKPGPNVVLEPTDIAPAATLQEMQEGTQTEFRSMSPFDVAHAVGQLSPVGIVRHVGGGLLDEDALHLILDPDTASYSTPDLSTYNSFVVSTEAAPRSDGDKRPVSDITITQQDGWAVKFTKDSGGNGVSMFTPYPGGAKNGAWRGGLHSPPRIIGGASNPAVANLIYCKLSETLYVVGYSYGAEAFFNTFDTTSKTFGPTASIGSPSSTTMILPAGPNKFIAFKSSGGTLYAILGVITGNTIAVSTTNDSSGIILPTSGDNINPIRLSDSLFTIAYKDTSNSYGYVKAISVSGSTVSFGPPVLITTNTFIERAGFLRGLSPNSFFIAYPNASGLLRSRVATITGATITLNTEYAVTGMSTAFMNGHVAFYEYSTGVYAMGGAMTTSPSDCVLCGVDVSGTVVQYTPVITIPNIGTAIPQVKQTLGAPGEDNFFLMATVNINGGEDVYVNNIKKAPGGNLSTGTQFYLRTTPVSTGVAYTLQRSFDNSMFLVKRATLDSEAWFRKLLVDANSNVSIAFTVLNANVVEIYTDSITKGLVYYGDNWFKRPLDAAPARPMMINSKQGFGETNNRVGFFDNLDII